MRKLLFDDCDHEPTVHLADRGETWCRCGLERKAEPFLHPALRAAYVGVTAMVMVATT